MGFNHFFDSFVSDPLNIFISILFVFYLLTYIEYYFGSKSIKNLKDFPPTKVDDPPFISFIIPARNEGKKIKEALSSVLALDYPRYEVIAINDRSDDSTGRILNDLSAINSHLKVVHITSLPPGWLGKNYALDYGAKNASGKYFIFTDADVVFKPDTLNRVLEYIKQNNTDHLAMAPSHVFKKTLLTAVICIFEFLFMVKFKPWKVANPKSKYFIGIGSFNMITADAYKNTGGFETLRMRPDDDIMLGKLVKKSGYRSNFVYAPEQLSIEWYQSVGEMIRAFYKNTYSGFNYSLLNAVPSIFMLIVLSTLPYISLFFLIGISLIIDGAILVIIFLIYLLLTKANGISIFYFLTYPVACSIIAYLMIRSVFLSVIRGGVDWRGTFYSLKELKSNKV